MNFAPTEQPEGPPDGQPAEQPVAPPAYVAPIQPVTPTSRRSRRLIAAAILAGAIGVAAVAIGLSVGGAPVTSGGPAVGNARGVLLGADTGTWTAPNGATAPGPNAPNIASGGPGAFGPGAFGPGGMGRGGPVGGPGGFGSITITSVNLPMITLTTADGWMRTIDTTGATVKRAGQTVDVSSLAKGDAIMFSQTRQSDGTYKITSIQVLLPQVDGTVKSVVDNTITVTQRDNTTKDITVTGSTTYRLVGTASSLAAVTVGARLNAQGTVTGGTFTATVVNIQPAMAGGTVTGTGGTSITVKTRDGSSLTINVDATTTYQVAGKTTASLSDIAVGATVMAEGTQTSSTTFSATIIRAFNPGTRPGPGVWPNLGAGHGMPWSRGGGTPPAAAPAPAGTTN